MSDFMENFQSGYFRAGVIEVPSEFIDHGAVYFQQSDPHRSFVQLTQRGDGSTFAIDFLGNAQGSLLMVVPNPDHAEVRILLALDTAPGVYDYRAYFYGENRNEVIYQVDGSLEVDATEKDDCGCLTLGAVIRMKSPATEERRAICAACPFNLDGICGECGCQIMHKTSIAAESCPIGKWGPNG